LNLSNSVFAAFRLPARPLAAALVCACLAACASVGPSRRVAGPSPPGPAEPFVDCRGERSAKPTVILEAGAFGTSADWDLVLKDLSADRRVCAYDRLGLGQSPDRDGGRATESQIAGELARMLDRLGEREPVILVGHSNGAFYAEAFATLYPARVAGVAYVDGVGTDDLDDPKVMADLRGEERRARLAVIGGRLGLAPLVAQSMIDAIGLSGPAAERKRQAVTSPRHLADARDEVLEIIPGLARIRALGGVEPAMPTAVIVASLRPASPAARAWRAAKVKPAGRACQGWVLDAVGASHVSVLGRDRSYVEAAINWLSTPGLRTAGTCSPPNLKE
jgi:pimeloyl-ACP methyl ester carboxylesterase